MGYPPNSKQGELDESLLRVDGYTYDEHGDDVVSLLEENARLRGLAVKLTELILRNVVIEGDGSSLTGNALACVVGTSLCIKPLPGAHARAPVCFDRTAVSTSTP
jgi:hypothetical protein